MELIFGMVVTLGQRDSVLDGVLSPRILVGVRGRQEQEREQGACRRLEGHVTRCWGRGQSPQFLDPHSRNSRTAGPIVFKLCTLTWYPERCWPAGLGSRHQMLGEGQSPPIFGPP